MCCYPVMGSSYHGVGMSFEGEGVLLSLLLAFLRLTLPLNIVPVNQNRTLLALST